MVVRDVSAMVHIPTTTTAWTAVSVSVNKASVECSVTNVLTGKLDYCNAVMCFDFLLIVARGET